MTKKKETKQKDDAFDVNEALANLELPRMFVDGFKAYIENNNLKFKSEKEFEKSLKEFGELQLWLQNFHRYTDIWKKLN